MQAALPTYRVRIGTEGREIQINDLSEARNAAQYIAAATGRTTFVHDLTNPAVPCLLATEQPDLLQPVTVFELDKLPF